MSLRNEFKYYVNNTKVYTNKINNTIDTILSNIPTPNNCFIDNYDFNEIAKDIFDSLPRIVNAANSYPCITDNDKQNKNDEITIILKEISEHIINEFLRRGYRVKALENGDLTFKKTH